MAKCDVTKEQRERAIQILKDQLQESSIKCLKINGQLYEDVDCELKNERTSIKIKKIDNRVIVDYRDLEISELCAECHDDLKVIHHEFFIPEEDKGIISKFKSFFKGE